MMQRSDYLVNGDELPQWQVGPAVWEVSNERGAEGWELVTVLMGQQLNEVMIDRSSDRQTPEALLSKLPGERGRSPAVT